MTRAADTELPVGAAPSKWTWGVALAALAASAAVAWWAPLAAAVALLSDDAFYYLTIARNVVSGAGSTFDGIAATNGYHPAWMGCTVALQWLVGPESEAALPVFLGLVGLVAVATLASVHELVDRYVAPGCGVVAVAACLLPNVLTGLTNGMETGLLLLGLTGLLWVCFSRGIHAPDASPGAAVAFGALLGAVTLARLDAVFLFGAAGLLYGVRALSARTPLPSILAHGALLAVGFSLVLGPYLVWNTVWFGSPMPVSGAVKSSLPELRATLTLRDDMPLGLLSLVAVAALELMVLALDRRSARSALASPLPVLWLGCVLHFVHTFLFMTWGVYWWHFTPYGLAVALSLARLARAVIDRRPAWRPAISTAVAAPLVAVGIGAKALELSHKGEAHRGWLEAAHWARDSTAADAVFALKDAGLFGYFSERRVVNLDGKANGADYAAQLARGEVETYLRDVGVRYVADVHALYADGRSRIVIPRPNLPAFELRMDRSAEVYRSAPLPHRGPRDAGRSTAHFVIWSYGDATGGSSPRAAVPPAEPVTPARARSAR